MERQLGRPLRGDVRVAVRCACGLPSVVETHPVAGGEPFPTLYWLTCTRASKAIGTLEAQGMMRELNERISTDEEFANALAAAQRDYVERRDLLHRLDGAGGVGGGPIDRVKCLHAHYAHYLVNGQNPVGAEVAARIGDVHRPLACA